LVLAVPLFTAVALMLNAFPIWDFGGVISIWEGTKFASAVAVADTVIVNVFDAVWVPTVTRTVKVMVAAVVGVPLTTPAELRVRPAGSAPEVMAQVGVPVPPVDVKVVEYGVPTIPAGSEVVVMVGAVVAPATVIDNDFDAVWVPTVTRTVKLAVAAVVGVPLSTPAVLRVTPAGSAPEVTAQVGVPVPPVEVRVAE
jgi:hypothetical protein